MIDPDFVIKTIDLAIKHCERLKPYIQTQYRSAAQQLIKVIDNLYNAEHDLLEYPIVFKYERWSEENEGKFRNEVAIKFANFKTTDRYKKLGIHHGDIMEIYNKELKRKGLVDLFKKDTKLRDETDRIFSELENADREFKNLIPKVLDPFQNAIDRVSEKYEKAEAIKREYLEKTETILPGLEEQRDRLDDLRQEFRKLVNS